MSDLATAQADWQKAYAWFQLQIRDEFPGATEWDWFRACSAAAGENTRRNADTSRDAAMAASETIRASHAKYIRLLHVFYTMRDGPNGVLGGRGL